MYKYKIYGTFPEKITFGKGDHYLVSTYFDGQDAIDRLNRALRYRENFIPVVRQQDLKTFLVLREISSRVYPPKQVIKKIPRLVVKEGEFFFVISMKFPPRLFDGDHLSDKNLKEKLEKVHITLVEYEVKHLP